MKALAFSIFLFGASAMAYIPSADFILSKVTRNAGSGIYQVKQEVHFPTAQRNITVTETWWVQGNDVMFLKIEGPLFTQYFLYKNNKKFYFDNNGKLLSMPIPRDFHADLFFERSSNNLRQTLINKKLIPAQTLKKRPSIKTTKDLEAITKLDEPYLKLSRLGGKVSYVLGYAAKNENEPGVWIEQDRFVINKLKLPTGSEIVAESFAELSRNLTYPRSQKVIWDNQHVQIELSRGDSLRTGVSFFDESNFSKLASKNTPLPEEWVQSAVGDFYKRFR